MKKLLSVLLALALTIGLLPVIACPVFAEPASVENIDSSVVLSTDVQSLPGEAVINGSEYVSSVTITPNRQKIKKGNYFQFTAEVDGTVPTVTWSVTGGGSGTSISSSGRLYVGSSETATTLTVRATSTFNTSKYAEARVEVVEETPYISSVTISPKSVSVKKSDNYYFDVNVVGTDYHDVYWTLTGNNDDDTYLSDGCLYISMNETASTLKVRATSLRD